MVLDLDGPLLDGMHRHYQCYSDILVTHGYTPCSIEVYWKHKRNRLDRRALLGLSGATDLYGEFVHEWLMRIETRSYLSHDRVQRGALHILREWNNAGVRILLATMRNDQHNLQWQLEATGLSEWLHEVIVMRNQVDARKADAVRSFLRDTDSSEVIVIGDTEADIDAARALGIRVCALTCGLRSEEFLRPLSPDLLERDLRAAHDRLAPEMSSTR